MGKVYKKTVVNVCDFVNELHGDVGVNWSEEREMDGHEYTVLSWEHDGRQCLDVFKTDNGCIEVHVEQDEDEHELQDNTFSSFYTSPVASLRSEFGISAELQAMFLLSVFD